MTTIRRGKTNVNVSIEDGYRPDDLLRLTRLARNLRVLDQLLSTDLDTLSIDESGPAPAWTTLDGDHISFSLGKMPLPKHNLDVAVWLGTNAHELGHVLFTPRKDSPLMQRCIAADRAFMPGLMRMHNIVEDQRQERLILAKFAPWRAYLVAALSHHLVADSDNAWLLMAGRTWLPAEVRDEARARFVDARSEATTREVARLIGDFQRLTDPGDTEANEAWAVLEALHGLFDNDIPTDGGCGNGPIEGGDPERGDVGGTPPPTADEADESEGADSDGEPSDADGEGSDSDSNSDSDDTGSGNSSGNSDDDSSGQTDSDGASGGKGSDKPDTDKPFDLDATKKKLAADADEQLKDNEATRKDLQDVLDSLDHSRGAGDAMGDAANGRWVSVSDSARKLQREVGDSLLDLKDESEPGWVRRVERGRLSIRRYIQGAPTGELFDRFEPGQMDASEMEVVVLVDVSSSMHRHTAALADAIWAIHRSVDDLDGRVTVIAWDDGPHTVVSGPGKRATGRMFVPRATGGTVPNSALAEAFRLLADSTALNRLMIILTDGDWFGEVDNAELIIDAMNSQGIATGLAFLDDPNGWGYNPDAEMNEHHCSVAQKVTEPQGLARLFRRIATERIRARL